MKLVSVVMPSYNTPYDFLKQAVDSITKQTYENIELIIVDDNSTKNMDKSIIQSIICDDTRIKLVKNRYTKGVAGALNTGIDEACGEYIVRMDSDDISLLHRIEKQITFLENNPDIVLVAGYTKSFGASKRLGKSEKQDIEIRTVFFFQNGIAHPTVCIRKSFLNKYNLRYNENVQSEDYDLWVRCSLYKDFKFATLPKKVLMYRVHANQVTQTRNEMMFIEGKNIRRSYIRSICPGLSDDIVDRFVSYAMFAIDKISPQETMKMENTVIKQIEINEMFYGSKLFQMTFWKTCTKKAISYVVRGNYSQIIVAFVNIIKYIASMMILEKKNDTSR